MYCVVFIHVGRTEPKDMITIYFLPSAHSITSEHTYIILWKLPSAATVIKTNSLLWSTGWFIRTWMSLIFNLVFWSLKRISFTVLVFQAVKKSSSQWWLVSMYSTIRRFLQILSNLWPVTIFESKIKLISFKLIALHYHWSPLNLIQNVTKI